jgi:sugar O-acyltransferase (sialic acid O-acetyltransferase NeuD family)
VSLPVIVIGGGGHGRVVIEALLRAGKVVKGVIDPDRQVAEALPAAIPWLGAEEALAAFSPGQYQLANGVGSIGDVRRRQAFERLKRAGYAFASIIHPAATVAQAGTELGEGSQIMAGAVLQPGTRIGIGTIINTRACVDHDGAIGDHCHIAPGATLCGNVAVGDDTHIGAGAVVIQGVRIGKGCMIGAGAVVLRDVADGLVVYSRGRRRERPRG